MADLHNNFGLPIGEMLVTKSKINKGDIVSFKLVTGEEIIARANSFHAGGDLKGVKFPIVVHVRMQNNQAAIAFAPFMVTVEEDAEFFFNDTQSLIRPLLANNEVKAKYLEATSSIIQPPSGLIVP
jgi:hypothetical protein